MFWSGGKFAEAAVLNFAKIEGMQTLEMTARGKILQDLTSITSCYFTRPFWDRASASFAKGAEGASNVFQNVTEGVSLNSSWKSIEFSILKDNGNEIIFDDVVK